MDYLERIYEEVLKNHLREDRQMLFIVGPHQVGKTIASSEIAKYFPHHFYFNWDIQSDRVKIIEGPEAIADAMQLGTLKKSIPIVVFDKIHKYGQWETFLKGFFDKYSSQIHVIVIGSARSGGDSLTGRYFSYRLHPLSVAELLNPMPKAEEISPPKEIHDALFSDLLHFGGFPEPFLKKTPQFYTRWKKSRSQQLFQEDLRDLTKIKELGQIQVLAEILRQQVGQLISYTTLAKKVNVSIDTIRRWLEILKSFYYCYTLQPWSNNVTRSILKEPKIYLWDWSYSATIEARAENFIASHLLKAVHFWNDIGWGDYGLYYVRDKEKREVDFLVTKNAIPWFLVEVKNSSNGSPSKSLFYFQEMLNVECSLQVALDMEYIDRSCFETSRPLIVPAKTFLSQLV